VKDKREKERRREEEKTEGEEGRHRGGETREGEEERGTETLGNPQPSRVYGRVGHAYLRLLGRVVGQRQIPDPL